MFVAGMYNGAHLDQGVHVLQELREFGRLRASFFAPVDYADLQYWIDEPPGYRRLWSTTEDLADLSHEAVRTIAARGKR